MRKRLFSRAVPFLACLAALLGAPGCETDDDDYDHNPPLGQGGIIVENFTYTDLEFFLDGRLQGKVSDDDDRAFDFPPGVYRVVLNDEDDSNRSWAGDVDVLQGRLTILNVRVDPLDSGAYTVQREIQ
ncbi:MAG: hypothetical protein R6X19_01150 [Kiritimatiellia bacterium]